jgi:hypothetical protein
VADMAGSVGPCEWPSLECPDLYGLASEEEAVAVEDEAKFILWSFTGQRYGLCELTVTPPPSCFCAETCECRGCSITLPAPVYDVSEVLVEGEVFTDWVQLGNTLRRATPWPRDVEVTYRRGLAVPAGGDRVVSELARELALYRCNSAKCRLPSNITQRTRQGDTIQFGQKPTKDAQTPLTGIPMIDLWIRAVSGVAAPGRVWSPDITPWVPDYGVTSA